MDRTYPRTRWRVFILLTTVLAFVFLVSVALLEKPAWEAMIHPGFMQWERGSSGPPSRFALPPRWLSMVGVLLTLSLTGLLVMYVFPDQVRYMGQAFLQPPKTLARVALIGLSGVALIVALGLSATLAMSTFPIAIILIGALFLASFMGIVALSYSLGKALLRRADWMRLSPVANLLLGMFFLFTLSELPYLGLFFGLLFVFLGAGVFIMTRFGTGQPWSLETFREE